MSDVTLHTPCIRGPGRLNQGGYAVLTVDGKADYQHRLAYRAFIGLIPNGLQSDHVCRNRWCINAAHLEAVSQQINTLRGIGFAAINAKKTHCSKGHELTEPNIYRQPKAPGRRHCVACLREYTRIWKQGKTNRRNQC